MLLSTILLIIWGLVFIVKGTMMFAWWHFLWIYPAEILVWLIMGGLFLLFMTWLSGR